MKLYRELAAWWPLLSAPEDYAEEAKFYLALLLAATQATPRSMLELGSGGGNNAVHMKHRFEEVVLTDLSPHMLDVSRALNPDCEHVVGDMRTLRLGRQFDCVFVHDAVVYMTTREDLAAAIATAYEHCRPGGSALFAPDHLRETFRPSTECGGHDATDRALRYLEWTWDPDPSDDVYTVDYVYALRDATGAVHTEHDRHFEGLFSRATWLDLLGAAGFEVEIVPLEHSAVDPGKHHVFVCRKAGR